MNFKTLYHQHKNLVYNLALHYTQNKEDAEEIAQEVFLSIHKNLASFEGKSSVETWIYRITVNKSIDFLNAKNRQKRNFFFKAIRYDNPDNNIETGHFDHPGVQLEQKESVQTIFSAINQLAEKQKTVIILLKIENRTQKEVAEIMNTTEKAVESLYQRAKTKLKKLLDQAKENER